MGGEDSLDSPPPAHVSWWHQYDQLLSLHLPELTGKTVLDVGAVDGYFSFAAERFGASRVVALGADTWREPGGKARFDYMRRTLSSSVEDLEMDVLDVSPETVGSFDVVLFLGMLPHTRHPLLALERLASVTRELLVVETLVDITLHRSPAVAFHPAQAPHEEASWWGPNRAAVSGMLRSVGFKRVVAYPSKRFTAARAIGLPARVKVAGELVTSTTWRSRQRMVKELAIGALTRTHLVAHGWIEQAPPPRRADSRLARHGDRPRREYGHAGRREESVSAARG
jgi:tRNA (mo5U34)-methyltransferase